MARLKVEQTKSTIGCKKNQRDTLRSLGLKRIGDGRCGPCPGTPDGPL